MSDTQKICKLFIDIAFLKAEISVALYKKLDWHMPKISCRAIDLQRSFQQQKNDRMYINVNAIIILIQ